MRGGLYLVNSGEFSSIRGFFSVFGAGKSHSRPNPVNMVAEPSLLRFVAKKSHSLDV